MEPNATTVNAVDRSSWHWSFGFLQDVIKKKPSLIIGLIVKVFLKE